MSALGESSIRLRVLGLVLVLLVGLAVTGYKRASGSSPRVAQHAAVAAEPSGEQRLRDAQTALRGIHSAEFSFTSTMRTPGRTVESTATSVMDFATGRTELTLSLPGNPLVEQVFPGERVEEIINGSTLYLRTPPALRGASGGREWFSIPRRNTGDALGGAGFNSDLRGLVDFAVTTAVRVEHRGWDEDLDAEHVVAHLDMETMAAVNGRAAPVGAPSTVPMDLYLDDKSRPLQLRLVIVDEHGNGATMQGSVTGYDGRVDVPVIDPADAFPVADQGEAFRLLARAAGYAPAQ